VLSLVMAYRLLRKFSQAFTRLDTPPLSNRRHPGSAIARPRSRATHQVVRWRCADLRAEVNRRFSVTVTKGTIGKWLRKLKLTRLQPRPFHPKKDPATQEALKRQ